MSLSLWWTLVWGLRTDEELLSPQRSPRSSSARPGVNWCEVLVPSEGRYSASSNHRLYSAQRLDAEWTRLSIQLQTPLGWILMKKWALVCVRTWTSLVTRARNRQSRSQRDSCRRRGFVSALWWVNKGQLDNFTNRRLFVVASVLLKDHRQTTEPRWVGRNLSLFGLWMKICLYLAWLFVCSFFLLPFHRFLILPVLDEEGWKMSFIMDMKPFLIQSIWQNFCCGFGCRWDNDRTKTQK